MIAFNKKTVGGLVLGSLLLGCMLYLLYAFGLIDFFTDQTRLLHFINAHRTYAALIFIGLQALQVVASPIPGEMTGFVGGMLFHPVTGILYSTIGLALGSWIAFLLARLCGRPLVEMVVTVETINRYDYVMRQKGLYLAFLLFLVPGFPKDIFCYLLGLGSMRQIDFLLVSISGRLLGTTLLTVGGTFFRKQQYGALFTLFGISLVFILIAMVCREMIERWFRRLESAQLLMRCIGRVQKKKNRKK
jgi:uncharacterized membrane protein YdjX (TVP38/TMEM64 family)